MLERSQNMPGRPEDDLLSTVLRAYQLRAGIYSVPKLCGTWQFGTMGDGRASFHLIGDGECWLHMRLLKAPVQLTAGDLVLIPHDDWHLLSDSTCLKGLDNIMSMSGDGDFCTILCGNFEFSAGRMNPILAALPSLMLIRSVEAVEPLKILLKLMFAETQNVAIGTKSVMDKLGDTLFVMVLRQHLQASNEPAGLLAALIDERIRRALDAIHRDPARDWTVEVLAELASMSKTAFTSRFSELMGTTPKDYLTRWRMTKAELMLMDPATTVAVAAERSGYESEAAFRKAFKRLFGIGPRAARLRRDTPPG